MEQVVFQAEDKELLALAERLYGYIQQNPQSQLQIIYDGLLQVKHKGVSDATQRK